MNPVVLLLKLWLWFWDKAKKTPMWLIQAFMWITAIGGLVGMLL